jgi:hypothetical protein
MKRWKIAITYRADSRTKNDERIVTDPVQIGDILASDLADWTVAYLCITELVPLAEPVPHEAAA